MSALDPAAAPIGLRATSPEQSPAGTTELDQLARAAIAGRVDAVERLIAEIRPKIVSYCRARLGRSTGRYDAADDVAQEVCLAVVRALPNYRDMGRPFLAFVYGIAAHKVADAQRRDTRTAIPIAAVPDRADEAPGPEEYFVRVSEARRARQFLDRLPEQQREIMLLRVVVGLSAEETGNLLGITAGNVRVRQHRALMRLRTIFAEPAPPESRSSR